MRIRIRIRIRIITGYFCGHWKNMLSKVLNHVMYPNIELFSENLLVLVSHKIRIRKASWLRSQLDPDLIQIKNTEEGVKKKYHLSIHVSKRNFVSRDKVPLKKFGGRPLATRAENILALLRLELSVIVQELCAGGHNYHHIGNYLKCSVYKQPNCIFRQ